MGVTSGATVRVGAWGTRLAHQIPGAVAKGGRCSHLPQANEQTSWVAVVCAQSEGVCHQANSVMLRMVSIPERTKLFKTNLKNKLDSPSPQAYTLKHTFLQSWDIGFCRAVKGNLLQCRDFLYKGSGLHNLGNLRFICWRGHGWKVDPFMFYLQRDKTSASRGGGGQDAGGAGGKEQSTLQEEEKPLYSPNSTPLTGDLQGSSITNS